MAEKLGISQQAYVRFEGNPQLATFERLFFGITDSRCQCIDGADD